VSHLVLHGEVLGGRGGGRGLEGLVGRRHRAAARAGFTMSSTRRTAAAGPLARTTADETAGQDTAPAFAASPKAGDLGSPTTRNARSAA